MRLYQKIMRPLLFRMDPEEMHDLTLGMLRWVGKSAFLQGILRQVSCAHSHNKLTVHVFGLNFPNPVGLAAGYDKDGKAWRGLSALGFGHLEIGTVTPRPQPGNPRPRIVRLPQDGAVINHMGFPGRGADYVFQQLTHGKPAKNPMIIGVNIGKNKETPNQEAALDYVTLFEKFAPIVDYLTVNVSSPNTVGLRRLQARETLEDLLGQLREARSQMAVYRPILVKISPDLTLLELEDVLDAINRTGMDGIVATNTTVSREGLKSTFGSQEGGLSGTPLKLRSRQVVSEISRQTGGKLPIIGVGGIMNPADAKAMLEAGASLVQVYTGLIYAGPGLVKDILNEMLS